MGRRRGWIYALLLALVTINYMDRVALSVAAKSIAGEFHLSPVQMGYLFSSFLWTYVICLLPVGILIDRYGPRAINSFGIALWSLAIASTGAAWNFVSLLSTRLAMGVGEATSIPGCGRIVREWMPARERGFASTIYSAGSFVGPAVGAVLVGSVSAVWGWRASFVLLGALGFVWLACNLIWYDRPERVRWLSEEERRKIIAERGATPDERNDERGNAGVVLHLLKQPSIWGIGLSQGCAVYSVYLLLFWLPSYLQAAKHLNIMETGLFTAIPWACAAPLSIGWGFLSDRLLDHQQILTGQRRLMVVASLLCGAILLTLPFASNIWLILAIIAIALGGLSTTLALNSALVTDLVHKPSDVGKAVSMIVLGGNAFGVVAPIVTGYVVQGFGSYDWAFVIAGILLLIGAVLSFTMTRRVIVFADAPRGGVSPRLERA